MMFKVVFMICIGLSMGFRLYSDVDDLEATMKRVDERIQYLVEETCSVLKTFSISINYDGKRAKAQYALNITRAAEAYWAYVEEAETKAAETGLNIDPCVISGNAELSDLKTSFIYNAKSNFDTVVYNAHAKLDGYSILAKNEPLRRLTELWLQVRACNNDECAAELERKLINVYKELENDINDVMREAEQYVLVDYVRDLSAYSFEAHLYSPMLDNVIEEVKACIAVL